VYGFRCYDNIHRCKLIALYTANAYSVEREMSASACTRSVTGYRHCCSSGINDTDDNDDDDDVNDFRSQSKLNSEKW